MSPASQDCQSVPPCFATFLGSSSCLSRFCPCLEPRGLGRPCLSMVARPGRHLLFPSGQAAKVTVAHPLPKFHRQGRGGQAPGWEQLYIYMAVFIFPSTCIRGALCKTHSLGAPKKKGCLLGSGSDPTRQMAAYGKDRTQVYRVPGIWNTSSKLAKQVST